MNSLNVGKLLSGRDFTLPLEYQVHTTALIGIRGSGKTVGATDIAEEMLENGLQFVTIDPVGVWYGLRCRPDGTPSDYPVVIIGGQHGDLPLEKDSGSRVADAILEHSVSCVIDMSADSKNAVRKFVTDFCDRLMESNPSGTRHIFLEEAPELVPQKPMGEQKRSLAAVDRLVRLGRNKGYGCTLISQRFATINKDVLTQCESLIALRCIGKNDRDAAADWIAEVVHDTESEKKADKFIQSLTRLENGAAWFWSPQWLKEFVQIQFRRRKTFHPGETRQVGQSAKQVQLLDVGEFVDRFKRSLSRSSSLPRPKRDTEDDGRLLAPARLPRDPSDVAEIENLRKSNSLYAQEVYKLRQVVDKLKAQLEPQYHAYQALFGDLESISPNGQPSAASPAWQKWKEKLGSGPGKIIDILLENGECTRVQLKTLAGYSRRHMSNVISALNANQLIEKDGDKVRLRQV